MDFTGYIECKFGRGSIKKYLLLAACLVTRGIHLEAVGDKVLVLDKKEPGVGITRARGKMISGVNGSSPTFKKRHFLRQWEKKNEDKIIREGNVRNCQGNSKYLKIIYANYSPVHEFM